MTANEAGWYLAADRCPHPEPDQERDSEAWDEWTDHHPWSPTPDVGHVCLFSPIAEPRDGAA